MIPFLAFVPGIAVASYVIICHTIKCLTLIQEKFNKSLETGNCILMAGRTLYTYYNYE